MNVHLAADRLPTCSRFIFWNGFVQRVSLYLKKKMYFPFQPAKNITKNLAPSTKNVSPPLQKKKLPKAIDKKKDPKVVQNPSQ
jgi:site-specific recombinase XerC